MELKKFLLPLILTATFYSDFFHGQLMANGKIFNQNNLTAASSIFPLGTKLIVKNGKKSVKVTVTDRCNCELDLSKKAFKQLASLENGIIKVKIEKAF